MLNSFDNKCDFVGWLQPLTIISNPVEFNVPRTFFLMTDFAVMWLLPQNLCPSVSYQSDYLDISAGQTIFFKKWQWCEEDTLCPCVQITEFQKWLLPVVGCVCTGLHYCCARAWALFSLRERMCSRLLNILHLWFRMWLSVSQRVFRMTQQTILRKHQQEDLERT